MCVLWLSWTAQVESICSTAKNSFGQSGFFSYFHFKLKYFVAVFNESVIFFSGYAFEYLIETLNDSSRKKFFNVARLGGTKYGNVA